MPYDFCNIKVSIKLVKIFTAGISKQIYGSNILLCLH